MLFIYFSSDLISGMRIRSHHSGKTYEVQEVGVMYPDEVATKEL